MSPFRSNRRGVMILLNNNFEQQVESIKTDPNGNYIILNMTIQGKKVTLVNIYGPNEDNPQFYHNLKEKYSEFDNEMLIICGDWNFVQNPEVDYYNYLHINNPRARKVVLDTMAENSLVDVWRLFNEDVRAYTWKRMNPVRKQARLDYFLINETCLEYVMDTNINPGYRTDHSSILLKLKFINNERGLGYWKFNNSLLKNKDYIKLVKDTIQEVKDTYKTNDEQATYNTEFSINDQLFLETLLMVIRGNTIQFSSFNKRKNTEKENKLEADIKKLEEEISLNINNINDKKLDTLVQKK